MYLSNRERAGVVGVVLGVIYFTAIWAAYLFGLIEPSNWTILRWF